MQHSKVQKVVIVGGGTAGWMAAASLAKLLGKNLHVTLVESDEIGTVGVGEATIPTLLTLHELLKIKEQDFVAAVQGTFKLGISFENWRNVGEDYIHSFGYTGKDCWAAGFQHFWLKGKQLGLSEEFGDYCTELVAAKDQRFAVLPNNGLNYAYHFDASLYAKFLRGIAEDNGAIRQEGKVRQVLQDPSDGFITGVELESGQLIEGDFFIDCSGFRGLLIEQTLHTGYDDWSHWLPADSAVAVQTHSVGEPLPYTRSIAHESGWQWRIPLQHRVGNGLVYCSKFWSDDEATAKLLGNLEGEPLTDPRVIKFTTGTRRKHWNKNCVAMGLASGFMEPDIDEFNSQMTFEIDNIRDFIVLHYHVTERDDSRFWRHCRSAQIPDSLQHRIDLFKETGRVFKVPTELFGENSWVQVMLGQGLLPEQYHPIVNMMDAKELEEFLTSIKGSVNNMVRQLPPHQRFIDHYCKAPQAQIA